MTIVNINLKILSKFGKYHYFELGALLLNWINYTRRTTKLLGGYIGFTPSVRPSIRPSRMPYPLCNVYSSGWILSILGTNDH